MNIKVPDLPADIPTIKVIELADNLAKKSVLLEHKTVAAGFDGFIDTLVKVIKMKEAEQPPSIFSTIGEFGQYIVDKKGASLSLEMEEQSVKLGGNMPIMANAMGQLGVTVHCIGALGYPHQHPIFEIFPSNCKRYSFANPGHTTAFEFSDGKIMMGNMGELNKSGWQVIKERIGLNQIAAVYKQSDLVCMLNWSEIDASTNIWKGFITEVVNIQGNQRNNKSVFFDLADCSKRSDKKIEEAIGLVQEFAKHTKVILSLNRNEAGIIHRILFGQVSDKTIAGLGEAIFSKMGIDIIVVHAAKEAAVFNAGHSVYYKSFYIPNPKISTGAGDNFNAGFCAAVLLQLPADQSLILANAVSGYYVREGRSATLPEIVSFLHQCSNAL